ncbi:class F sortase [Streptomyces rubiginosohelvolus]|uniref:class F sortase n=1 Tax=Streptomyces rubiginosohelvolus TaxID=67362 RepID=UPI0036660CF0
MPPRRGSFRSATAPPPPRVPASTGPSARASCPTTARRTSYRRSVYPRRHPPAILRINLDAPTDSAVRERGPWSGSGALGCGDTIVAVALILCAAVLTQKPSPWATPSPRPRRTAGRRRAAGVMAVAVGAALACIGFATLGAGPGQAPERMDRGSLPVHPGSGQAATSDGRTPSPPVRIRIPAIGLDQPLIDLRVQQDGRLGVPDEPETIGWWSDGPRPGGPGATVVVGHVDSANGHGAFHGLSMLDPGDKVSLVRDDRSTVTLHDPGPSPVREGRLPRQSGLRDQRPALPAPDHLLGRLRPQPR